MKIVQHVSGFHPETGGSGGHFHTNYSADADIMQDGEKVGQITFAGASVALVFENHKGHYHIDFTAELQEITDAVLTGDYDAR